MKLPKFLTTKLSKTGLTRGADDDMIFQNRVTRCSTVLIPFEQFEQCRRDYERGFIVLVPPSVYFDGGDALLAEKGLELGINALVFYETRQDWIANNPELLEWSPADSRITPLGGKFVARIPANTATNLEDAAKINRGFTTTRPKGAGIRVYEYADRQTIMDCKIQLEFLFWKCLDAVDSLVARDVPVVDCTRLRDANFDLATTKHLVDLERLQQLRVIDSENNTICPLCLERLSANDFFGLMDQADGRAVPDLTVTKLNLFHLSELRTGQLGHRTYNLGWGHHHCNVVVKDVGIIPTLIWMKDVVQRNERAGIFG